MEQSEQVQHIKRLKKLLADHEQMQGELKETIKMLDRRLQQRVRKWAPRCSEFDVVPANLS